MSIVIELLELLGHDDLPPAPQYRALLDENQIDYNTARELQITSLTVRIPCLPVDFHQVIFPC